MSKRALKKYLHELSKEQLEEQILDLYQRFKPVKTYYDFTFNPREDKLISEAKFKINKEYFPQGRRRTKARRSVAQKYIKHFQQIGMEAGLLADLMLYNIETAQKYNWAKPQKGDAFFRSIANSFGQAVEYIRSQGLEMHFKDRLQQVVRETERQEWHNLEFFHRKLEENAG